jgi:hypothetical protein
MHEEPVRQSRISPEDASFPLYVSSVVARGVPVYCAVQTIASPIGWIRIDVSVIRDYGK